MARLKEPFTRWPPMATLGRAGSEALAERFAKALASELLATGITLDYAPVLDIHTNPEESGDRRSGAGRAGRGRRQARARDHSFAARARSGGVREAFSGPRRHQHRLSPRAAARRAPARPAARRRVRAVSSRDRRAGGVHHDRARARSVAGRDAARHAVAGGRAGAASRRTRLRGRDPERRPRDEGGERAVSRAGSRRRSHSRWLRCASWSAAATSICRGERSKRWSEPSNRARSRASGQTMPSCD